MGAPLNAHRATASLARAAPTGGRCARPASSRCTTRPQTRVRTPLVASGSRWLDEQHPFGRLLGPAAAVAAVAGSATAVDHRPEVAGPLWMRKVQKCIRAFATPQHGLIKGTVLESANSPFYFRV